MQSFINFLKLFFKNSGHYVFVSIFISKLSGFIGSLVAINMLSPKDFGWVSIVNSISIIFLAFNGFGSNQILLRYGSLAKSESRKNDISSFVFVKGFANELIVLLLFASTSLFYLDEIVNIWSVFLFFFFRIIGFYFYNHIQCYYRIKGDNKKFAKINNIVNLGGLLFLVVLSYFFGMNGYLVAIAITPFISLFWIASIKISEHAKFKKSLVNQMWSFGLLSVLTAVLSDLLFTLDVIILGFLLNEVAAAEYRTALLIPANIVFLSSTFLQSDYPILAKNYKNKQYLKNYIKNYYKLFIPICIVIFLVSYFFTDTIISLFFSKKYPNIEKAFIVAIVCFCFSMLGRNIFGNLVSAIGKMKLNTMTSFITLIFLVSLSYFLVPIFGVLGMVYTIFICVIANGLLLMIGFFLYYRKLS